MIRNKVVDNRELQICGWNREQEEYTKERLFFFTEKCIIDYINNAKEMVCITTFLLANEKIVQAIEKVIEKGVRVYLLIASENTLEKNYESEGDFSKKCIDSHIILLNKLSGKIFIRSARLNHAKFIFIDPFTNNAYGLICTGNFTEEGVTGRNEELHHDLYKDEVDVLATYFKHAFWNCAEHEMFSGKFSPADRINIPVNMPPKPEQTIVTSLEGNESLHDACMNLVKKATKSLIVAAFGFDKDNDIVKAIEQKAKKGVKVTILCRIRPKNNDAMVALQKAGAIVYGFQYLHAKCIIADNADAIMMTANFEDISFNQSFEVGCLLTRQTDIDNFLTVLNNWIETTGWSLCLNTKLMNLKGFFIKLDDSNFFEQKKIIDTIQFDCGRHSPSLELIKDFEPKEEIEKHKQTLSDKCLYCEINYTWKIEPPYLQIGSNELRRPRRKGESIDSSEVKGGLLQQMRLTSIVSYYPKIFQEYLEGSSRRVVAIRDDSELEDAIKLKKKMKCEAIVYEK